MFPWIQGLKRSILLGFAAGLITALVTLLMQNYYRSEERILPVENKSIGNLGNLSAAAAAFGVNMPGGDASDANFVDIIQSRWMAERLLNSKYVFKTRRFFFGSEIQREETLYAYLKPRNSDRAVARVRKLLSVARDLKSKILVITAETASPELSQEIASNAGRFLEEFVQRRGQTRGGAKAIFSDARLKEARMELERAEGVLKTFLDGNRNYRTSADPGVQLRGQVLEAEMRMRQQVVSTLAVGLEQALMEEKDDIPIVAVLDPANLPQEKSWPNRSLLVLTAFLGFFTGSLLWLNRRLLLEFLKDK